MKTEPAKITDAAHDSPSTALQLIDLEEFLIRPKLSWHVRDLLPANTLCVVFGAPKSGKTFAVCDLVMHAAHGMHWCGYSIAQPLRVAFLAGEGRGGLRLRLQAWRSEHGAELRGAFKILPEAVGLAERIGEVRTALSDFRPDVVVIDTVNAFFGGGDENSTQDMTKFTNALRHLIDELHCSVIVIHHTGLADRTRARGSGVLRGAADVVVQVAKDENGTGLVGFQVVEGRDLEAWPEPLALKLRKVESDWLDDEGLALTTCVVESSGQPVTLPGRAGKRLGEKQLALISIAQELAVKKANGSGTVLLARRDIAAVAKDRGINKSTVSMAWGPLQERGYWQLKEPGSVSIRIRT